MKKHFKKKLKQADWHEVTECQYISIIVFNGNKYACLIDSRTQVGNYRRSLSYDCKSFNVISNWEGEHYKPIILGD